MIFHRVCHRHLGQFVHGDLSQTPQGLLVVVRILAAQPLRDRAGVRLSRVARDVQCGARRPRHGPGLGEGHAVLPSVCHEVEGRHGAASADAKRRDAARVAAERRDVVLNPLQARALVAHPHVERPLIAQAGQARVAKNGQAEVEGDVDDGPADVLGEREQARRVPVRVLGAAPDEPADVEVHDDG